MTHIKALKSAFFKVLGVFVRFFIVFSIAFVIYENRATILEFILRIDYWLFIVIGFAALFATAFFSFCKNPVKKSAVDFMKKGEFFSFLLYVFAALLASIVGASSKESDPYKLIAIYVLACSPLILIALHFLSNKELKARSESGPHDE